MNEPKVLLFDIETAPMLAHVWGIWDQNVALNQIHTDWHLLSWSAKWLGDHPSKIMYMDQRSAKNIEDDSKILKGIWDLLDEADVVITQNGKKFDQKKLYARFILSGMKPPSPFKHIDTFQIAKKHFAFTSNKLEYLSEKLCDKYKKLTHQRKFGGFQLWKECIAGNIEAWKEMERYNKYDVLSLEELYTKLQPWDNSVNLDVYRESEIPTCNCGSRKLQRRGFNFSTRGKYQRWQCRDCGKWLSSGRNLLSKERKESLLK